MKTYDIVIIGGGPAGLSAGLYAGRAKMDTLIIEKQKYGGQIVITDELENYPGSIEGETGPSLIGRMVAQCDKFGCTRVEDTITDVELEGDVKVIKGLKEEYRAKAVIITGGATHTTIGCPG
ncbi:MAG: FAD-dependent oxidoreductase, partial [Mogibacterium sp.]|nr:FAD-dependent oxidoreductase [Mogibacterium sp.]